MSTRFATELPMALWTPQCLLPCSTKQASKVIFHFSSGNHPNPLQSKCSKKFRNQVFSMSNWTTLRDYNSLVSYSLGCGASHDSSAHPGLLESTSLSTRICMVSVYMLVCVAQVAVQEVRRLQKYGVTAGELANYKAALMRDSEHVAAQWESVPSVDTLDYCMECLALNHTFMAQEEVRPCLFLHKSHWME